MNFNQNKEWFCRVKNEVSFEFALAAPSFGFGQNQGRL
jgi:hypothetical protein